MKEFENEKKIYDHRRFKYKNIMAKDYIPFLAGRPKRETIITKDDIINLKIALNTSKSIEEFFKNV